MRSMQERWEYAIGVVVVILIQGLVVWCLSRVPRRLATTPEIARMKIVLIQRVPRMDMTAVPNSVVKSTPRAGQVARRAFIAPTPAIAETRAADGISQMIPDDSGLVLTLPDDALEASSEHQPASAGIFGPSKASARYRVQPGRFKNRPEVTVESIVRDFGRLAGLWPPGYTDDPCPGINRTVEQASGWKINSERERRLLADAISVQQRFCQDDAR